MARKKITQAGRARRAEHRAAQWKALSDRLAAWEEEADPAMVAEALARFDGYSERNAMLIASQDPDATEVRGYRAWQDAGRQVHYPEEGHGITIVAFRGEDKPGDGEAPAPEPIRVEGPGGQAPGDEKPSLHFSLATLHDVRWTRPLLCQECGEPVHRTGYDPAAKRHTWTHTAVKASHPAVPAKVDPVTVEEAAASPHGPGPQPVMLRFPGGLRVWGAGPVITAVDAPADGERYADQRGHDVAWMTAAEREAVDVS